MEGRIWIWEFLGKVPGRKSGCIWVKEFLVINNIRKIVNLSSITKSWRFFEDVLVGEKRKSNLKLITEDEIINFAKQYDPQWFHTDKDEAKKSKFKGIIASGIHVAALWRLLDHEINSDINFVCGIGWDEVRWKNPLRPNSKIYVTSECLSKKNTSSEDRGVAIFNHSVKYDDSTDILIFKGTCLIYKKR